MTSQSFHDLFGLKPRDAEENLTQQHMDIAASIQVVTEEVVIKMARHLRKETGEKNLCLAGGVALNCVANGKLQKEKVFDHIWVQPAAGDAGGALGAAQAYHYMALDLPRAKSSGKDHMKGSYLGPQYSSIEIEKALTDLGAKFHKLSPDQAISKSAQHLADGKAIGWFQGRMEFGPRALGGRSIIADARSREMQTTLNLKVKFRESFRPFAPSVLAEKCSQWFDFDEDSPYMLMVANVQDSKKLKLDEASKNLFGMDLLKVPKSQIPAVTHVDYSARIQTVHAETNPNYHRLISEFEKISGCPVIVNTSFNVRGEPIVCSPSDAFRCFIGTHLDVLVVENYLLYKEEQDKELINSYFENFDLD